MRLFVALPVAEGVRARLAAAVAPWREEGEERGWRFTRPEGWHVTLAFLGEVAEDRVAEAARVAADAAAGTGGVELHLGTVGHFGRRVLTVGLPDRPEGRVAALGAAVQTALAEAELPLRPREVRPHLTLARARRRRRPVVPDLDLPAASWTVEAAVLYASHLHPEGARYEVVERLPLT